MHQVCETQLTMGLRNFTGVTPAGTKRVSSWNIAIVQPRSFGITRRALLPAKIAV